MRADPQTETFSVVPYRGSSLLVRSIVPAKGVPYKHTCPLASFELVAHAVDACARDGFTMASIAASTGLPATQVATAMAYLRARKVIRVGFRRAQFRPGDDSGRSMHCDAMLEYAALRDHE